MRLFPVIFLALVVAACSSSGSAAKPVATTQASTTTTEATESTTTTVDPKAANRAEIEDVLTQFYGYVYENGFVEGAPGLENLATTPIYQAMRTSITDAALAGYSVGDGDQAIAVMELLVDGDTATGTLCRLDQAPALDAAGNAITEFSPDTHELRFVVIRTSQGWRVSDSIAPAGARVPCEL